jgi:hypothetical protein
LSGTFSSLLDTRQFTLLTHHKPMVMAFLHVFPPLAREQGYLSLWRSLLLTVQHMSGAGNTNADALSHHSLQSSTSSHLLPSSASPFVVVSDYVKPISQSRHRRACI